jgi:hypothetical protein
MVSSRGSVGAHWPGTSARHFSVGETAPKSSRAAEILFQLSSLCGKFAGVTIEIFNKEIAEAIKAFDRHVVCLEKAPEDFTTSLASLVQKAIKAYEHRGPNLRHGIALDKQVTVILSQGDTARPLCGIYFNLHSPYQKDSLPTTVKPLTEIVGDSPQKSED